MVVEMTVGTLFCVYSNWS